MHEVMIYAIYRFQVNYDGVTTGGCEDKFSIYNIRYVCLKRTKRVTSPIVRHNVVT